MLSYKRKYTVASSCQPVDSTFKRIRAQTPNSLNLGQNSPMYGNQQFIEPNPPQQYPKNLNLQASCSIARSPSVQNVCINNNAGHSFDRISLNGSVTPQPVDIGARIAARRASTSPFMVQEGSYRAMPNNGRGHVPHEAQDSHQFQSIDGFQNRQEEPTSHVDNSVREPNRSTSVEPRVFESRGTILKSKKESLQAELADLRKQVDERYNRWVELRKRLLEFKTQRLALDDYRDIATQGQNQIRDHLNQIYNPGRDLAQKAKETLADVRKSHQTKLEEVKFEKSKLFSALYAAIDKKEQEFIHQKEFNLRTLEHYKVQEEKAEQERAFNEALAREKVAQEKLAQDKLAQQKLPQDKSLELDREDLTDMDVQSEEIIGDDPNTPDDSMGDDDSRKEKSLCTSDTMPANDETDPISAQDDERTDLTISPERDEDCIILSNSESKKPSRQKRRIRTRQDSEETDVDNSDEERSFTPCQAQRPK